MALRVLLAGHNLDRDLLLEIRALLESFLQTESTAELAELRHSVHQALARGDWTPETLSAAYARVSRDPRSVDELRAIARQEVDKARRSNETIVFGLGHSSVAEHAVFNLDVLGLSRLAVEVLERGRLASYTEKSQRYILLEEDWTLPSEIRGTPAEPIFRDTVSAQNAFYRAAYDRLLPRILERHPEDAGHRSQRRVLEGWAKEDARYALGLATTVQLGLTVNARTLEGLIARCRAHGLDEVRSLGDALLEAVAGLAPSLVKYTEPSAYRREARAALAEVASALEPSGAQADEASGRIASDPSPECFVRLARATPQADDELVAVLLYAAGRGSLEQCRRLRDGLGPEDRRRLLLEHLKTLGPHDPVLREYEHVDLVFDLVVSASCFAQLKRHRMATLTPLPYDPSLGVTVPEAIEEVALGPAFREIVARSEECSRRIAALHPEAAVYPLTNAHRRRVLIKLNARECYHLARLREDAHAQWDIRRVSARMLGLARAEMPLTLALAAGKDRFEEVRRELFRG